MTPEDFTNILLPHAKELEARTGMHRAIPIAVAALETGWGARVVVDFLTGEASNNFFNIKAFDGWPGPYVRCWTTEYLNERQVDTIKRRGELIEVHSDYTYSGRTARCHIMAKFREYPTPYESMENYAQIIQATPHYAQAWAARSDPLKFFPAIRLCGYATDPNYAVTLMSIYTHRLINI